MIRPDDDLPTYLGSRHSALGFLLFAVGCAALLAFGVLAFQFAASDEVNDLSGVIWLIPLWGVIAVPLGLSMRRKEPSVASLLLGCALLAIPVGMAFLARF